LVAEGSISDGKITGKHCRGEVGRSTKHIRDLEFSEIRMVQPAKKKNPTDFRQRKETPLNSKFFFVIV